MSSYSGDLITFADANCRGVCKQIKPVSVVKRSILLSMVIYPAWHETTIQTMKFIQELALFTTTLLWMASVQLFIGFEVPEQPGLPGRFPCFPSWHDSRH